jgi:alpha-ketoglutarate-dependent taurine dioxygenase
MLFRPDIDVSALLLAQDLLVLEHCGFAQPSDLVSWLESRGSLWSHAHYLSSREEPVGIINNSDKSHPQAGTFYNERPSGDWHIDTAWTPTAERPRVACLYGHRVTGGNMGATWFADGVRACETLSPGFVDSLRPLRVLHYRQPNRRYTQAAWEAHYGTPTRETLDVAFQHTAHPLIQQDMQGRDYIMLSAGKAVRVEGWTEHESRSLLEFLGQHITRPEHVIQHVWQQGQLVMWENDRWNHYGVYDYEGHDRELWRAYLS